MCASQEDKRAVGVLQRKEGQRASGRRAGEGPSLAGPGGSCAL